jgi:mono/diheme cytochrome c family protein
MFPPPRLPLLSLPLLIAFSLWLSLPSSAPATEPFDAHGKKTLPTSTQRVGDPVRGRDYLINGDYLVSGAPLSLYRATRGSSKRNELKREGENASLPPSASAVTAPNGQKVVVANCLSCHAQELNGKFVLGLGNSLRDFTNDTSATTSMIDQMLVLTGKANSPEREAFAPFRDVIKIVSPHIRTKVIGTNPAIKLAYVLAAHRDPVTLEWQSEPLLPLPPADEVIPSDVPALWLMRKKNALYHNGMGRGDFARSMMAASLMTLRSDEEAAQIDQHFVDVQAFLNSLTPPPYPKKVDERQSARGKQIFAKRCSSCHGSYGDQPEYPNLLISLDKIGTDPAMARSAVETFSFQAHSYNTGWFGSGDHAARMEPELGYVAPPLDGVWATAPYLHNGSVPNLETLLDSTQRPRYWQRSFKAKDYDLDRIGWQYQEQSAGGDKTIYDTTLPGHSNQGHTFGDSLTSEERSALIEYLKTL